ncbi:hypothetical protein LZC95_00125 [Pendulispora brunnea]|uniref:YXWGXW repeat-containing protein n=1 Tax=Pendulispora brunnea TaxID=2905690 RepID=A0ABZ2KCE2_9BACT
MRATWLSAYAVFTLCIAGCVATASNPTPRGVVVNGPPPAPLQEDRPAPPSATAVWVNGYWHWTGAQYTWIPGHWEHAPPGQTWYGPRYGSSEGTFFYQPGGWKASARAR